MNSFKAGKAINSKDFKVGRTVFNISIFPAGEKANSSKVAIYINNLSEWSVFVKGRLDVGDRWKEFDDELILFNDGYGYADFVPQRRCHNGDLLDDGSFQLEAFIKVNDEEVLPHDVIEDEVVSKMKSHVDEKFGAMEKAMEKMMEKKLVKIEQRLIAIEMGKYLLGF